MCLTKLMLIRIMTGLQINHEGKGILKEIGGNLKLFQLNPNTSREANCEIIWNEIELCSQFNNEWEELFHKM